MSYQALYRMWRPQTFADVVGQTHITQTLQNALREETYTHAYLLSGPRGTGKTSTAKIIAKAVNCQHAPAENPCNECPACRGITQGTIVDVVEIDAASNNGVDEIRDLRDKVKYAPTEVKLKVYIIDEVHMLTPGAFNALLKTLEEPPAHVLFILATTEPHKIPLTIISRCQRFDFRRVSRKAILERLAFICEQEQLEVEDEALHLVAQAAEGGLRDALSLLDQCVSYAVDGVTAGDVLAVTGSVHHEELSRLADALLQSRVQESIRFLDTLLEEGKEPLRLVEDLIYYYRDVLLVRQAPELEEVLERVQVSEAWKKQVADYDQEQLFQAIEHLSAARQEMKWTDHPRIFLEVAFIQLSQELRKQRASLAEEPEADPADAVSQVPSVALNALQDKVNQLERHIQALQQEKQPYASAEPSADRGGTSITGDQTTPASTTSSTLSSVSESKLKKMLKSKASKSLLVQLTGQWASILEEVKHKDIKVHAWLIEGEPVACGANFFLLAFRSEIHRETTEKESHRRLIEEVVGRRLPPQAKMMTIMYNEWEKIKEEFIQEQQENEAPEKKEKKDPFYEEALQLVGEDLVEIKEDEDDEEHG